VGAVSSVLAASGVSDGRITPASLRWLMERCLEAGSTERLDLPGLKSERRAVIAGGLSILYTLATHFGIAELKPARGALRQGVIFDLAARQAAERRAGGEDLREASVRELQRRFQVDVAQAERVARVATALLGGASPEAGSEAKRELAWAAALHEAGMMISHHDHHRHSAYLLAHVDAPGFSQSQLRRIGELVLGQRGGLRKMELALQNASFALHLLCLRLAVIVCHARDRAARRRRRAGDHARAVVGRVAPARAAPAARRGRCLGPHRPARAAARRRLSKP
jgi:exopolyphosphatase/guanosine-5'-triphosphate,3'-diphosphate pyrophosphatase